jgi:predicted nucleic acid-binding protein
VKFWDSSAIVPTLLLEPGSDAIRRLLADDPMVAAWWATDIECASAIARRSRSGALDAASAAEAYTALSALAGAWAEIPPSDALRDIARQVVRIHEIRAADAFQLASARVASNGSPETLPFVTLDDRLAAVARREGFPVLP